VLGLYLRTARYYKPGQIATRLRLSVDSLLNRKVPGLNHARYKSPERLARNNSAEFFGKARPNLHLNLDEAKGNARRLQSGAFVLLNKEIPLGTPVIWDPAGTTRLWRYNLHYFDYAIDLAVLADVEHDRSSADALGRLLRDWIEHNPVGEGVGWHSYPIARRIVNWIQAVTLATPRRIFPDSRSEDQFNRSLYQQARFLDDHLEFDCLGNHLLANGKALLFAGLFFGGTVGSRWHEKGQRILWHGLREQILDDGGHEERSPMYHTIVLQDYLEVVLAEQLNKGNTPDWARERLIRMADFLDGILHPDGEIPLFGDSAYGMARCPGDVLAATECLLGMQGRWCNVKPANYWALLGCPEQSISSQVDLPRATSNFWPASGYARLQGAQPGDRLIVDTKPLGPSHLPAHGHCSLFSYELSLDCKRIIVDSGVEEYEAGPWRDFWRSTRAHNTLTVDGAEQSEMWASFRAGRRVELQQCGFAENGCGAIFVGMHRGFATQKSRTPHRRIIASLNEGFWLVCDQVFGHGSHRIDSYVHFHPQAWCRISGEKVEFGRDETRACIYPMKKAQALPVAMSSVKGSTNPIQGWYASEFGKREPNHVLCLSAEANLPWQSGYLIAQDGFDVSAWNIELEEAQSKAVTVAISIETKTGKIEKQFRVSLL
jgi:Heparinase II/III-like protein/Heparinase II/III N-terminus